MKGACSTAERCPSLCAQPLEVPAGLGTPWQLSEKRICSTKPAAWSNGEEAAQMGMSQVRAGCSCGRNGVMERHDHSLSTCCEPCIILERGQLQEMHPTGLGTLPDTLLHQVHSLPVSASHVSVSRVTTASRRYSCTSPVRGISLHLSFAELCFFLHCPYFGTKPH